MAMISGPSWADLDRSPDEFVTLLEEYRRRATLVKANSGFSHSKADIGR
jgi:hypothetical protein